MNKAMHNQQKPNKTQRPKSQQNMRVKSSPQTHQEISNKADDFHSLPSDIQKEILITSELNASTLEVFSKEYDEIFSNPQLNLRLFSRLLSTEDSSTVCLLVKKNIIDEKKMIDVMERLCCTETHMPGLCTLGALCAVLGWTSLGKIVIHKIDEIGVWNVRALLGDDFPAKVEK
jgi:hypothetical protein